MKSVGPPLKLVKAILARRLMENARPLGLAFRTLEEREELLVTCVLELV
jgi:hypothetical protein